MAYRGREKHTIEYVCVKSVDKDRRDLVERSARAQEVLFHHVSQTVVSRATCKLPGELLIIFFQTVLCHSVSNSARIAQLYEWHETQQHIWTVSELCSGGTLQALLEQDGPLPEATAIAFARDIASALVHACSMSVLLANVDPTNILCDALGGLKWCDLTRAVRSTGVIIF